MEKLILNRNKACRTDPFPPPSASSLSLQPKKGIGMSSEKHMRSRTGKDIDVFMHTFQTSSNCMLRLLYVSRAKSQGNPGAVKRTKVSVTNNSQFASGVEQA